MHATIAGVVLSLLTPAFPFHKPRAVARAIGARLWWVTGHDGAEERQDPAEAELDQVEMLEFSRVAREAVSPLERLEVLLHR